jgi:hypothetical protein
MPHKEPVPFIPPENLTTAFIPRENLIIEMARRLRPGLPPEKGIILHGWRDKPARMRLRRKYRASRNKNVPHSKPETGNADSKVCTLRCSICGFERPRSR